jgi:osmotically inducible protein OsmC
MKLPGRGGLVFSKALVVWRGASADGAMPGRSRGLREAPCSPTTRFGSGIGRNPDEMLAAAHAGCFTATLAFSLEAAGHTPTELSTEAVVTQEAEGPSVRISGSALRLRAKVPKLTKGTLETMAWEALIGCAIWKALRMQISLDAQLL